LRSRLRQASEPSRRQRLSLAQSAQTSIADCDERRAQQLAFWTPRNGQQSGDPPKLARALLTIAC
jgi:hypothetical protein